MSIDRTFIDKFDGFIFTIRRILYFGDTNISIQPSNPKHDKWRFINLFGAETNTEYYNSKNDIFKFDNDSRLKDEFANIYSCKSLNLSQMGDLCQIFAELDHNGKTAEEITYTSTRALKNINRRLSDREELVQSGSVIAKGKHGKKYTKNIDLMDGYDDKQKFIEALDFAVKKNNFSAFASTYKKLMSYRDGIEDVGCNIEIDHQLFHPILDEKHIWDTITAITEHKKININYCPSNIKINEFEFISNLIPLKIIYDNLYGRSYLFAFDNGKTITLRLDRIFSIKFGDKFDESILETELIKLNKILETAWLVSTNENTEHVVIRFTNSPAILARVKNEGRHGHISKQNNEYFVYEIDVNDSFEMTNWVLTYGSSCKVIEPQRFVKKIVEHLEEMAK